MRGRPLPVHEPGDLVIVYKSFRPVQVERVVSRLDVSRDSCYYLFEKRGRRHSESAAAIDAFVYPFTEAGLGEVIAEMEDDISLMTRRLDEMRTRGLGGLEDLAARAR